MATDPWPSQRNPKLIRIPSIVGETISQIAEQAHQDTGLDYSAYLQRLETLRLLTEQLPINLPDEIFAVRSPRRKSASWAPLPRNEDIKEYRDYSKTKDQGRRTSKMPRKASNLPSEPS